MQKLQLLWDRGSIKHIISYNYPTPIKLKIINHNSYTVGTCNCHLHSDETMNKTDGHILTTNFQFLPPPLKDILAYGCSFRLPTSYDIKTVKTRLISDIYTYVKKLFKQFSKPENRYSIQQWHNELIIKITEKFDKLSIPDQEFMNIDLLQEQIRHLKDSFVISYLDKCNNNYVLICKVLYDKMISNELNNGCYSLITNKSKQNVITSFSNLMENKHNIKITQNKFPGIYIIPKLHKTPVKFRPIISSKNTIFAPLYHRLNNIMNTVYKRLTKYCKTILERTGVNTNWIINCSKPITDSICTLNRSASIYSVNTYDFTSLYTNFQHSEIKKALSIIMNIAFGKNNLIRIRYFDCKYKKGFFTYNLEQSYNVIETM